MVQLKTKIVKHWLQMNFVHYEQKDMHTKLKSERKKLEGNTKGTLKKIRFDKHVDCLFGKLTEKEKYYYSYVIRNLKHTMKKQEIRKKLCNFDDTKKYMSAIESLP